MTSSGGTSNAAAFAVTAGTSTLSFINSKHCATASICTTNWNVTAGNVLIVMFYDGVGDAGGNISDMQGNSYTYFTNVVNWNAGLVLYGATLTSGGAPLTVNSSGAHSQMVLAEFSGVSLATDGSVSNSAGNTSLCPSASPLSVTTGTSDLLVSVLVQDVTEGSTTASSGTLAQGVGSGVGSFQFLYQIAPTAGAYTQQFAFNPGYNAGNQSCAMVALRAAPSITITSISPAAGGQGATVPVTLAGTNFVTGATVAVSNPGIAVSGVNVVSATQIAATFTIAANATPGAANVTVTTIGGASSAVVFTVNPPPPPPPPTLTGLSPAAGFQGASIPVTLSGTNFVLGSTVATTSAGIAVTP